MSWDSYKFDIKEDEVESYLMALAKNGKVAQKLENRVGLPRYRFHLNFIYPDLEKGETDREKVLIKNILKGNYTEEYGRLKNFPKDWIETSQKFFIPYYAENYSSHIKKITQTKPSKKETDLFYRLPKRLNNNFMGIDVKDSLREIVLGVFQVSYREERHIRLNFYRKQIKEVHRFAR